MRTGGFINIFSNNFRRIKREEQVGIKKSQVTIHVTVPLGDKIGSSGSGDSWQFVSKKVLSQSPSDNL